MLNNTAITLTTQFIAILSKVSAVKKKLLALAFTNDTSSLQDPIKTYGSFSVNHLKSVSEKYDPTQVFQKLQNSGFLVTKTQRPHFYFVDIGDIVGLS